MINLMALSTNRLVSVIALLGMGMVELVCVNKNDKTHLNILHGLKGLMN